ncbi:50S ribosomal protein L25/general stress protein Ctc [Lysinibacillus agricola]|uniref:Large ribosomal subunit protein bL25 n=1 Tax=Lysinibacillus agricola TaxID=2590012 RepID=A0ABX7ARP9_9BACI|nr:MULTISPECIES: 50S ribosomal protein L25/general stress protein Ctc [Lysinibacillus]KOS63050.1 50S ribosomal protein L25 [Lysinibacillus sp. FJAT-14222]QQP12630.1 50S ribosomal protein L25/general stress protein Ctc [Lysinibacillus agricola]
MSTVLSVKKRESGHRSTLTQLRKGGAIPAVIYGYKLDSTPISISAKEFKKSIQKNGQNGVFSMELDGKKVNVVVSEIQQCSLKDEVNHVDFLAINMSEAIEADVSIRLVGESVGISEGGILMQPNLEVKIKVRPTDLPEAIEVDITKLKIGESITVADIRDAIDFDIISENEHILVTIMAPAVVAEETVASAQEQE